MDPRQVKALFFDVDGTLVSYKDHKIHPEDMKNLRMLHDRGMKLFIASGRNFDIPLEAVTIEPLRPFMDGFIGINGQRCTLADGTLISNHLMDPEDYRAVRKCCEENHLALLYYLGENAYVTEMTQAVLDFSKYVGLPVPILRPMDPDQPTPCKICIYTTAADDNRLIKPVLKHTISANNHNYISDLIPAEIGKDTGIRDICAHFGIDPQQTMAFGDGENDISMLRYAGIGVAMGIAPDIVKASADYVTTPAEEAGISQALKHFGLI